LSENTNTEEFLFYSKLKENEFLKNTFIANIKIGANFIMKKSFIMKEKNTKFNVNKSNLLVIRT
jgi:hypothetical protein